MMGESNSARLKIRLLGEFQFLIDEKRVRGLNADRPQSLLAYLLLHRHAPQSRQHLSFLLWPDSAESQARTNLRNLLHTLRYMLPAADVYLLTDNTTVQWNPDASYDFDVDQFDEALKNANLADSNGAERHYLETAVMIYTGDLLPSNYDDWLILIREEMRQHYLDALGELVKLNEEMGDYRSAVRHGRRLWQQDALDETTAVQLMRLLTLNGDRTGVQRVYQTLNTTLQRELDVEPSPATREAYVKFLRTESAPAVTLDPIALPEWQPRPLPIPAMPFIGREKELADIAERLADPGCRLLTLVGLSGMGKTRLVLQTATGHRAVFKDGVAYTSLMPLLSEEFFLPALAEALKLKLSDSDSAWSQLSAFLSSKQLLLILENIDHLLPKNLQKEPNTIQQWLVDLLQTAPDLKIIVTAHQSLHLVEEWVYEIQGLPLPKATDECNLIDNSAVTLFVNSARRVDHQFVLTAEDLEPIIKICNLVDGMPMGIELAASWTRLLTCAEILGEITRNINFLRTEQRNLPERHRSVRAIFDHSWALLSPAEKQVLAGLSVFCGAFSRDAAEREAGSDLATLLGLVDKSLLQRVGTGQFRLHNLVRQYTALQPAEERMGDFEFTTPTSEFSVAFAKNRKHAAKRHQVRYQGDITADAYLKP